MQLNKLLIPFSFTYTDWQGYLVPIFYDRCRAWLINYMSLGYGSNFIDNYDELFVTI